MSETMTCQRLFADAAGESHFEDIAFEMEAVQYAPPAPPLYLSAPVGASAAYWFRFPEGWTDAAHPSPRRQLFIVLDGVIEGWNSAGETRTYRAGDRLLMEDTSGKGHGARAVGGPASAIVIALE